MSGLSLVPAIFYNVKLYSAVGDGSVDFNAAITSTTTALSSTTSPGPFTSGMVGKKILVTGAGASGVNLWSSITAFTDSQHVTINDAASTSVSGATIYILSTDDMTAIKNTMAATTLTGGVLYLPPGIYYAVIPQDAVGAQVTKYPVRVVGAGQGATVLVADGASLSATTCLFTAAAGTILTIEDLTTVGPAVPNSQATNMVRHFGTSGKLTVRRVTSTGFTQPIQIDNGATCQATLDECTLANSGQTLASAVASIGDIQRFRAYDTQVTGYGLAASNQSHAMYIHQGVDTAIAHCSFSGNRGIGFSIHSFNGSGTSPNFSVDDCYFASDSYQGILSNPTVRSRITNCRFLGVQRAVTLQFDAEINGCEFDGITAGNNYISQLTGTSKVNIRHCWFNTPAVTGTAPLNNNAAGNIWRVIGCSFACNQAQALNNSGPGTYAMLNCDFADDGVGHLILAATGTPTLSAINANVTNTVVVAGSNDIRGKITFDLQTGTIAAGSALFTVNFATTYGATPYVLVGHDDNQTTSLFYVTQESTTIFIVRNSATLPNTTGFKMFYMVMG